MGSEQVMYPNNDQKNIERKSKGSNWFVYFCSFTANILIVSFGFSIAWPSSVIPKLKSDDPGVNPLATPRTTLQISILAALPAIGSCFGLIIMPLMADNLGRKKTLFNVSLVLFMSFITLAFSKNIYIYFGCALINGFCEIILMATASVYNIEIATDGNRGKVNTFSGMCVPFGSLLGYYAGRTTFKATALIGTVCPSLFLLLSFFIPESPIFLASKELKCLKSLESLRRTKDVEMEYAKIKETKTDKRLNWSVLFKRGPSLKSLLLSLELFLAQQATGVFIIGIFMAPIFNDSGSYLSGNNFGELSGLIQIIFVFITSFVIDRWGRRPLLLCSNLFCIVSLFVLGLYFYLKLIKPNTVESVRWLPIFCILVYFSGYSIGMGPIPFLVMPELFSNEVRSIGVTTTLFVINIIIFVTSFSFPLVTELTGVYFSLWLFCLGSIVATCLIYFTLPETKGKSFAEIQNMLAEHKY